jgi:hypothetical protein
MYVGFENWYRANRMVIMKERRASGTFKVQHTPNNLAEKVAVALFANGPDSPAALAAGCGG